MKLSRQDLQRLQWALAFLLIMAGLGGGSVWASLQSRQSTEKALKEATAARKDIQARLARASEEQQELRDKIGRFEALKARGYIGRERRLDWIETIDRLKTARRIVKVDYELAPQRPIDAGLLPEGSSAGGFDIMSSQMRMQFQLLHEAELLSFLGELRDAVPALIQVRSCSVERLSAGTAHAAGNAQIKAECVLEWITLREGK